MLKVENLRKVFRTEEIETIALNGVSFEVNEGEFVAIMGPSGCGKSTLLNILGLLDNPTSGSYQLLGREVATLREKDRTRFRKGNIGFVFQSFNLIDELNVFENVEILADEPTGNLDSKNGREVMEMLSELNHDGTTVIMVTHSQHDSTYAHRVLHLFDGELVQDLTNRL